MTRIAVKAPAKVNLHLEVLGPRADGYHELWTLFQSIDLADELVVDSIDGQMLSLTVEPGGVVSSGDDNLVVVAATALREYAGVRNGASFHLRKRIPVGAGLGGGSADAAAALVVLDRLWDLRLTPEELGKVAASVGSDVAFFLHGGLALGRGRGEKIFPLPDLEELAVVVGIPSLRLSTAEVFSLLGPRLTSRKPDATVDAFTAGSREPGTGEPPWGRLRNDLEEAVTPSRQEIERLVHSIRATGPLHASMSGSGSAVFGIYPDSATAQRVVRRIGNEWQLYVGSTLGRRRAGLLHLGVEQREEDPSWK